MFLQIGTVNTFPLHFQHLFSNLTMSRKFYPPDGSQLSLCSYFPNPLHSCWEAASGVLLKARVARKAELHHQRPAQVWMGWMRREHCASLRGVSTPQST